MSVSTKNEKKQTFKGTRFDDSMCLVLNYVNCVCTPLGDKDKGEKSKRKGDSPDPSTSPYPCEADDIRPSDASDIQALMIKEDDLQKVFVTDGVVFSIQTSTQSKLNLAKGGAAST
jgi:hypothetical protein